jgi:hypothetical protein
MVNWHFWLELDGLSFSGNLRLSAMHSPDARLQACILPIARREPDTTPGAVESGRLTARHEVARADVGGEADAFEPVPIMVPVST